MKTNTEAFKQYLIECIDTEQLTTLADVLKRFESEYWNNYKRAYYKGNIVKGFSSWLQGLPSCFNVDFLCYRMLELGEKFGADLSTEEKQEDFTNDWFNQVAKGFFYWVNK